MTQLGLLPYTTRRLLAALYWLRDEHALPLALSGDTLRLPDHTPLDVAALVQANTDPLTLYAALRTQVRALPVAPLAFQHYLQARRGPRTWSDVSRTYAPLARLPRTHAVDL